MSFLWDCIKNKVVRAVTDPVTGGVALSAGATTAIADARVLKPSTCYQFHGWAPNQANSSLKFVDYSGALGDGIFQTNLSAANAWATAGYLTQANPTGAGLLTLVALPALSFDYLAGDSLFICWRGLATPEGGDVPIIANTSGTTANGIKISATSAGKAKVTLYQNVGALSRFGGTTTSTAFEAAVEHSFALAIDGVTGKHCFWVDGVRDAGFAGGFIALGSGGIIDTVSATALKLGGDGSTSSSIQVGLACQTRGLIILGGRRGLGTPVVADLDLLVANLHRNMQLLISAAAW